MNMLNRAARRVGRLIGSLLSFGDNIALVIIDMEEDFLERLSQPERNKILEGQKELIRACSRRDRPIFFMEFEGHAPVLEELLQEARRCVSTVTVLRKRRDGSFKCTNLDASLREQGVRSLILAGVNASCCVLFTANQAVRLGYRVMTCEKLIADGDPMSLAKPGKSLGWYSHYGLLFELEALKKILESDGLQRKYLRLSDWIRILWRRLELWIE